MDSDKRILVAVLNWGLGHAARCIPIINALIAANYVPVIASDGQALALLKKEFPDLNVIELPSYEISYSKKASNFKTKILANSPKLIKAIRKENKQTKALVKTLKLRGIISDNRLGVYSKKVPSAFVSHQLNVLSGQTTWISSKMHQHFIKKFDQCWVPDVANEPSLSCKLGHVESSNIRIKYMGILSRFKKNPSEIKYDLLALLSGPEPQRTLLEEMLLKILPSYPGRVLVVRGVVEDEQITEQHQNLTIFNFMQKAALEEALNASKLVLSRSGYTTILDLAKLGKKAFFIPTPGQFEQEYLAERLQQQRLVPFCSQKDFELDLLKEVDNYSGFPQMYTKVDFNALFNLFEGK